ncbi:MAG: hypothetical protein RLZZ618_574 [Pseudomonadota bacterium]
MLSWIFKPKKKDTPAAKSRPKAADIAAAQAAEQAKAQAKAQAAAAAAQAQQLASAVWTDRLQQAQGNDDALLSVAKESPVVDVKLAAVRALTTEAAMQAAELEFRTHDRRVFQAAKQGRAQLKARRETDERATQLIQTAAVLLGEPLIPTNRLVELDRAWRALDAALVSPEQQAAFADASARLTALTHERGEREAHLVRWNAQAAHTLKGFQSLLAQLATGEADRATLTASQQHLKDVLATQPAEAGALAAGLQAAVHQGETIEARLEFLASLQLPDAAPATTAASDTTPTPITAEIDASPSALASEAAEPTSAVASDLPAEPAVVTEATDAPAPEATPEPLDAVAQQVADVSATPPDTPSPATPAAPVEVAPSDRPADAASPAADGALATNPVNAEAVAVTALRAPSANSRWQALPAVADAALAAALDERFNAWQKARQPRKAPAAEARPARVKAESKPQKAARHVDLEPLLQQAEQALAEGHLADTHQHLTALDAIAATDSIPDVALRMRLQTVQAEYARLKGWQQWGGGRARDDLVTEAEALANRTTAAQSLEGAKFNTKALADEIDTLRKRWKELDRLGGATSQTLWKRFDEAVKLAYVPVAAHLVQLEAARQTNLLARQALLDTLDASPAPDGASDDGGRPFKEAARLLDHFQLEWRKLGPVEHTVPRKASKALLERHAATIARLEQPLQQARRTAQAERERLVARAKELAQNGPSDRGAPLTAQVRDLQAEWQHHARQLPLSRQVENALWAEFKAATDAVFAQREAAFSARDAEFKVQETARVALIERLEALHADSPLADIKRTLAEVDSAWRQAGETSRAQAGSLESRFKNARANAQQHVNDSAQRRWQQGIDGLLGQLKLCEAREADGGENVDTAAWEALPNVAALPAAWTRALDKRKQATPAAGTPDSAATDAALLKLEAALDLPTPEEHQAARRDLKLRAMKAALESRPAPAETPASIDQQIASLLEQSQLSPIQHTRLHTLLAGLRASAPRTKG